MDVDFDPRRSDCRSVLTAPARYFPLRGPRYDVAVGLSKLGADFGNGAADDRVFQLDRQFDEYRRAKLAARRERLGKYVTEELLSPGAAQALTAWLLRLLPEEYPDCFRFGIDGRIGTLRCALTGEALKFDDALGYISDQATGSVDPAYTSALDAIACQLQEDITVTELDTDGRDRSTALHVCFPNRWAPADKSGGSFLAVHQPVPMFERVGRQSHALLNGLLQRGPFVRFTWGLSANTRLNHHPDAPADFGGTAQQWLGREFDPARPQLHLRVERQTVTGLPGSRAFAFTIRTYLTDVRTLDAGQLRDLSGAVLSMTPESLAYKGLAEQRDAIVEWLQTLAAERVAK